MPLGHACHDGQAEPGASVVAAAGGRTTEPSLGESGQLERIQWEIQEDFLIARRAYENVAGADPEGINGTTDAQGAA